MARLSPLGGFEGEVFRQYLGSSDVVVNAVFLRFPEHERDYATTAAVRCAKPASEVINAPISGAGPKRARVPSTPSIRSRRALLSRTSAQTMSNVIGQMVASFGAPIIAGAYGIARVQLVQVYFFVVVLVAAMFLLPEKPMHAPSPAGAPPCNAGICFHAPRRKHSLPTLRRALLR